ncbi:hypothetical protein Pta02_19540 [Planobispora takensis]|uniref:Uncharacterized protein n=1 Tax=Planobispora takensis TaxID=1367882 RepID=A0A8J3SUN8_9ACTN|nr:hypothetical protein Pta02_19540 [Planobispora takensis]
MAAGTCALPVLVVAQPAVAGDPVIRSINLRPAEPVVRPDNAVRLVIDVVARGVSGPEGVTVRVEPGAAPRPSAFPEPGTEPSPAQPPGTDPSLWSPGAAPPVPEVPVPSAGTPSGGARPSAGTTPVPGQETSASPTPVAEQETSGSPTPVAGRPGSPPARVGQDWETWRFLPEKRLNRWYPAGRWTITAIARSADGTVAVEHLEFWLKRETVLRGVEAVKEEGAVVVRGVLNRVDPQGYLDYAPFAGQPVDILHRREETDPWQRVSSTKTDSMGYFTRKVRDHRRGDWRVRFPGTPRFAPGLSRIIQIGKSDR